MIMSSKIQVSNFQHFTKGNYLRATYTGRVVEKKAKVMPGGRRVLLNGVEVVNTKYALIKNFCTLCFTFYIKGQLSKRGLLRFNFNFCLELRKNRVQGQNPSDLAGHRDEIQAPWRRQRSYDCEG